MDHSSTDGQAVLDLLMAEPAAADEFCSAEEDLAQRLCASEAECAKLEEVVLAQAERAGFEREAMRAEAKADLEASLLAMAEQYCVETELLEEQLRAALAQAAPAPEHAHLTKSDAVAIGHFVHQSKEAYHKADAVAEEDIEAERATADPVSVLQMEAHPAQAGMAVCSHCGGLASVSAEQQAEQIAAEMATEAAATAAAMIAQAMQMAEDEAAELSVDPDAWARARWAAEPNPEPEPEPNPEPEPEREPEPEERGLHFATRVVALREHASLESGKVGQLEAGELVHIIECADHGYRVFCRSVTSSDKEGWASLTLRRPGQERAVLLQRVARPANVPSVGESYLARQRVPVRDRAEVSSARIGACYLSLLRSRSAQPALLIPPTALAYTTGWMEAGELLHVDFVRMDDAGRPKVMFGEGFVSFWSVSNATPMFVPLDVNEESPAELSEAPPPASEPAGAPPAGPREEAPAAVSAGVSTAERDGGGELPAAGEAVAELSEIRGPAESGGHGGSEVAVTATAKAHSERELVAALPQ